MRRRGTTLVELMIVVAIIAILAAIAVTCWRWAIRWAREAERYIIVSYLERELRWMDSNLDPDTDISFVWPDDHPGKDSRWTADRFDVGEVTFAFSSPVYCSYGVRVNRYWWAATAFCDYDGDGLYTVYVESGYYDPDDSGVSGGGEVTASCDVGLVPKGADIATDFLDGEIASPQKYCNRAKTAERTGAT